MQRGCSSRLNPFKDDIDKTTDNQQQARAVAMHMHDTKREEELHIQQRVRQWIVSARHLQARDDQDAKT